MEEELHRKKVGLKKMDQARERMIREKEKAESEINGLETDLISAVRKNRDDLARLLIKKSRGLKARLRDLESHLFDLERDVENYRQLVRNQTITYDSLKLKAEIFFQEQTISGPGEFRAGSPDYDPARPELEIDLELARIKNELGQGE